VGPVRGPWASETASFVSLAQPNWLASESSPPDFFNGIERKADSALTFSRYWDRGSSGVTLKAYELRVFCSFPRNRVLPGTSHYPCPRHLRLRLPDAVA
jgi:hypothetical protein